MSGESDADDHEHPAEHTADPERVLVRLREIALGFPEVNERLSHVRRRS